MSDGPARHFAHLHAHRDHFVTLVIRFFQTTGWPGVVSVVGNWFGHGKKGLIMGLWNTHTSIGNIVGAYIAGHNNYDLPYFSGVTL